MNFESKVIQKSRKEHRCLMCCREIPKGSIYISLGQNALCPECAYIMQNADKVQFKEGNFTEMNIPNCLRKIRNEYRKDPAKAWEKHGN